MDEYPLVNRSLLGLLEPAFGHLINEEELMLRNDDDVIAAAALGVPEKFPTVTDDLEESKKLFTDYFRRMYGAVLYTHVKHKHRNANDGGDRDRQNATKIAADSDVLNNANDGTPPGKVSIKSN